MKTVGLIPLFLFWMAPSAQAGFVHPLTDTGEDAAAIRATSAHSVPNGGRVMPDRVADAPAPAAPATTLPANVKAAPAAAHRLPSSPAAAQNVPHGPVPRAADLPSANHLQVPGVNIPQRADGLLVMKPQAPSLRGTNRAQIYAFLKNARALPLPKREHLNTEVAAREIAQRYRAALFPTPYKSFRTAYQLHLAKVSEILNPPSPTQYENMVKRLDSLFLGLEYGYPQAVTNLWQLAESPTNPRALQARDALFAGLLSERAGWETPATLLLAESAAKRAEPAERYLGILWGELENLKNQAHVEQVVAQVNAHRAQSLELDGDQANFAMAKRMLLERPRAPLARNPAPDAFVAKIHGASLRDRFALLTSIANLRRPASHDAAVAELTRLEAEGHSSVRSEARLALARTMLQKGASPEALALYRKVEKNGKNRLVVLAEQTYAEYLSGEYQESLGKTVALESPYFQYGFAPDVNLVEILSRKAMCDFGGAEAGVERFRAQYARELAALDALLAQKSAARDYYSELVSYGENAEPMRYQRFLLQLAPVMENQKTLNQALADLETLDRLGVKEQYPTRPTGFDAFAASMRARWTNHAGELRTESAEAALREARYLADRLRHTFAQVELLDLDVSTAAAKNFNLQSALNYPAHKVEEAQYKEEKFHWPFENEIWEDEIDFMKAKNPSKCAMTAAR